MPIVDFAIYRWVLPLALGINIPPSYIIGLLPFVVFFNVVTPLYMIPLSYVSAKAVNKNLRLGNEIA
jgi:hypothetical protein